MDTDRSRDLPSDLKSLAANLAALAPSTGGLDRDQLMYRAGWEACGATSPAAHSMRLRAARWLWPLSTAALFLIAATLGVALATRELAVQVVYVEKPPSSIKTEKQMVSATEHVALTRQPLLSPSGMIDRPAGTGHDYLSLRERILAFGVDRLPASLDAELPNAASSIRDSRYGALIRELRGG